MAMAPKYVEPTTEDLRTSSAASTNDSAGENLDSSNATSESSVVGQPSTLKADQKEAGKEDKQKEYIKKDVYHTKATGDTPEAPKLDYTDRVADYYRNGQYNLAGDLIMQPRSSNIFAKEDGVSNQASIRIYSIKDKKDYIPSYTKFILDAVQESHTERSQIVETFGDFYVFMFGERPPVYNFAGTLINSKSASWLQDFMFYYEMYLRGTKCVENNAVALITYGGRQVEGLIINTSNQTSAATEMGVPFQFSVIVFERRYYNFSPDMGYFVGEGNKQGVDEDFVKMLDKVAGKSGAGTSTKGISDAITSAKDVANGAPSSGLC